MSVDASLQRAWYAPTLRGLALVLLPLSWLFGAVIATRRALYASGLKRRLRVPRPVIVVGNITVGGTGKTPFTIWLAGQLAGQGKRVGIVLRGYGGRSASWPREVTSGTPWQEVGDEAALLQRRTGAIVVAGPDRVAAARLAIERGADVVLSDDGLQHYRLERDCEIALLDAQRGLGNARLLPAGPLREPASRLREVDLVVATRRGTSSTPGMALDSRLRAVVTDNRVEQATALVGGECRDLVSFRATPVHAVAGIGNPQAFFAALVALGLDVRPHAFADHAVLTAAQISFDDDWPVLMTEKDAVRCHAIAASRHWAVRLDVVLNENDARAVLTTVNEAIGRSNAQPRGAEA